MIGFYAAGIAAFPSDLSQSTLTEQSLLSAAVIWEGFVSDMFVAYINRDAARFKEYLKSSLNSHLGTNSSLKYVFDEFGTINFPDHLTKKQIQELADDTGNNITFSKFDKLARKANSWLIPDHARKFTGLSAQQKAVIDSVIALRNHVAHRSQRSLDAMNTTLAIGALHPTGLQRLENRFHNVGAWLKATPAGQQATRLALIIGILDDIGATF